jgi:site-specific DNA recombinase
MFVRTKSAYLYIRVSTDEQKRKGYSLPEQEDRLLKYCEYNNIEVKGIYSEDFSAKNFNRPAWKKLIEVIKKRPSVEENSILFVKWDRFSRNIEYAYEMIGLLRKNSTIAMAIDQPIDFSIPESIVMLAVYLSIPEAENTRRALNTSNGIRRAKLLGRYPNKAPIGFVNLTGSDGKKYIAPKEPEAEVIRWIFGQLAKNCYMLEEVRRMAGARGFKCSKSNFWKFIRNPVYCGLILLQSGPDENQVIKGVHIPLISEALFYEVQTIITTKRRVACEKEDLNAMFFLKGYLICPLCNKKLRGSFSQGKTKKYPYYHCSGKCKIRISASLLNDNYNEKLQKLALSNNVDELYGLVLEDINVNFQKTEYLQERYRVSKQLEEQELMISKVRKLFVEDRLKFDDFSAIKNECMAMIGSLKKELKSVNLEISAIEQNSERANQPFNNIFQNFNYLNTADKKHLVSLIPPDKINFQTGELFLELNSAIAKILLLKE